MTTATWDQVHAGDTVRGADQRLWEVFERTPGPRWVASGAADVFRLRLDGREVTTTRRLIEPAPLVQRADHSELAGAWQAFYVNGFDLELIGESMTTATADPFAAPAGKSDTDVKLDRYNRYLLPHPETGKEQAWTRVSTLARTLADEYGLTQWMKRNVAKGMALRPDLIAAAAAADPEEDKKTLESIVKQAEDAAGGKKGANLGTAFHQAAQRHDRGVPLWEMKLPEPLASDVLAYHEALRADALTVVPEYMERVVCLPELGVAGRLDRIVRQLPGVTKSEPLSVLDLKSGKDLTYGWLEIEIQQACYANASHMWDAARQCWEPMPKVDRARALVAWAPVGVGRTQILGVNIISGYDSAQLAVKVRERRKTAKGWLVKPDNPAAVALHLVSSASSQKELAALWDRYNPAGLWSEEVNAAAQARFAQLATV